jgi:CPA2 family monovalent cation:H+ antiporter-2
MDHLNQILILLATAVTVVVVFQRLRIPTSLGYLLVGVLLGPYTMGPQLYVEEFAKTAEFGVVFLLFTIGLNYSLPQLQALRQQVLGLGTGQVGLTTLLVALLTWAAGLPAPAAFVFGAVFAQSSTTIIASLMAEQGEENSNHGRLGLAMSVFQDVTAVPFIVIIPVLGVSLAPTVLASSLGMALAKAVLAFALIFIAGRWLLRPLFHTVAERRSAELFTLAVLLVALVAAWLTNRLGLSLAFGGFLAGMMLGDTEFRHQVESSMRPFRDVLLGLFFVGIGMRFNPGELLPIWQWALLGSLLILASKLLVVTLLVRRSGKDLRMALRTGMLLGVGGEFGLALVAIALDASVLDAGQGQVAITSVLLAMVLGAVLIRFNAKVADRLLPPVEVPLSDVPDLPDLPARHVLIGGYGRVGHTLAVLLHAKGIPFIAFDADPGRVALGRSEGFAVYFGDIADPDLLASIHIERAALVALTVDHPPSALKALETLRQLCPELPVVARARDLVSSRKLVDAGATHSHPETIEASLRLGESALQVLNVPEDEIAALVADVRKHGYLQVMDQGQA